MISYPAPPLTTSPSGGSERGLLSSPRELRRGESKMGSADLMDLMHVAFVKDVLETGRSDSERPSVPEVEWT